MLECHLSALVFIQCDMLKATMDEEEWAFWLLPAEGKIEWLKLLGVILLAQNAVKSLANTSALGNHMCVDDGMKLSIWTKMKEGQNKIWPCQKRCSV